jgi:predicted ArsR family transcriptional regulator
VTDFDPRALDTVIHGPVRLGVMSALVVDKRLSFTELGKRLHVTDGSLGAHLNKLAEDGYIAVEEGNVGRRPQTHFRATAKGRRAFERYLGEMKRLIALVARADRTAAGRARSADR